MVYPKVLFPLNSMIKAGTSDTLSSAGALVKKLLHIPELSLVQMLSHTLARDSRAHQGRKVRSIKEPQRPGSEVPNRCYLVYLKYWTLNLKP